VNIVLKKVGKSVTELSA